MTKDPVSAYACAQSARHAAICERLAGEISATLPKASVKIWHAMPVWFIGENPVVGYKASAKHVNLLFWNGQSFKEEGLQAAGKFRAAQTQFTDVAQIEPARLRRWLKQAGTDIWDFRGIVKSRSSA